jgi:hypothetical protein
MKNREIFSYWRVAQKKLAQAQGTIQARHIGPLEMSVKMPFHGKGSSFSAYRHWRLSWLYRFWAAVFRPNEESPCKHVSGAEEIFCRSNV